MEALDNFWSVYSNLVLSLGINGLLALSIWLTLACGMLALANAAFMGIGAYTASILTLNYGVPFPVAIAAGMVAPALVAFLIGKPRCGCRASTSRWPRWPSARWCASPSSTSNRSPAAPLGLNGIPQRPQWWHVALAAGAHAGAGAHPPLQDGRAFEAIRKTRPPRA
jgi:branched-chain amino acid transport system permease protein